MFSNWLFHLTLGQAGMPTGWGFGRGVYNYTTGQKDGTEYKVWQLDRRATPEDIARLKRRFGPDVVIDKYTLVGKASKKYSTWADKVREPKNSPYRSNIKL